MQKLHLALWRQGLTVQLPTIADEHVMDVMASKEVASGAHVGGHHYKNSPRAILSGKCEIIRDPGWLDIAR